MLVLLHLKLLRKPCVCLKMKKGNHPVLITLIRHLCLVSGE